MNSIESILGMIATEAFEGPNICLDRASPAELIEASDFEQSQRRERAIKEHRPVLDADGKKIVINWEG